MPARDAALRKERIRKLRREYAEKNTPEPRPEALPRPRLSKKEAERRVHEQSKKRVRFSKKTEKKPKKHIFDVEHQYESSMRFDGRARAASTEESIAPILEMQERRRAISVAKEYSHPDAVYLFLVCILLLFGLCMLFSASYAYSYEYHKSALYFISKQAQFAAIGVAAMIIITFLDYTRFKKLAFYFALPLGSALLWAAVIFGETRSGAQRWLPLGPFSFQPSEVAKFAVIAFFAAVAAKHGEKIKKAGISLTRYLMVIGLMVPPLILQKHLSGTVIVCLLATGMLFLSGAPGWLFGAMGAVGGFIGMLFINVPFLNSLLFSYAQDRIEMWKNPYADPLGKGMQIIQSLLAIGSGGLSGLGFGQSRQKFLYVPEPQNDFIFAITCEELGFIGAVILMLLFAALIVRGYWIALRSKDRFGSMMVAGISTLIAIQVGLNIAVVTGLIPNTGVSLPFFSSGGTSLMILLAEMGLVLSVSRQMNLTRKD